MENNIETQCYETYIRNLEYFTRYFPKLAKNINLFTQAIELEMYEEKWSLEYKDDGYFDLYNIEEDYFYYDCDSLEDAKETLNNITYDENNSFNTMKTIRPPKNYKLPKNVAYSGMQYLFPIYNYINKYKKEEKEFTKIEKFIFIGTGLGLHIPLIADKLNSKSYIIIEPNLEIFRLSLFVTDYTALLKDHKDIFFSIGENDEVFSDTFDKFLKKYNVLNYTLKFSCITESYYGYFDKISTILNRYDPLLFPFSMGLESLRRNIKYMAEGYNCINFYAKVLKDYPVCIVAPGPSLEKTVHWLEKHQDRVVIIALGASLKKLEKHNVKPDIITSVDPYHIIKNQFKLKDKEFYKNSIFLTSSNTHPDVLELFDKRNIYLYPVIFNIGYKIVPLGGQSIGEVTYALALLLGAQNIYLFGTDAALDQETGAFYSKEHALYRKGKLKKASLKKFNSIKRNDIIEMPGNFQETVFTTRNLSNVIRFYNQFTKVLKKDQKVYNTAYGAKFDDIEPLDYSDINTDDFEHIDKEELHEVLLNKFEASTKTEFTEKEKELITQDINTIKEIEHTLKKYKKLRFKDYDSFQYERLGVIIEEVKSTKLLHYNFLKGITTSYRDAVDKLLFDFFNHSKEHKQSTKHIKAINKLWIMPYEKILKESRTALEQALEENKNEKEDSEKSSEVLKTYAQN